MSKNRKRKRTPPAKKNPSKRPYDLPGIGKVEVWNTLKKDKEAIRARVWAIGKELYREIADQKLPSITIVSILTGGLVFTADLLRALNDQQIYKGTFAIRVEVIKASKYKGMEPGRLQMDPSTLNGKSINGQHVVLVDAVVESGETLRAVYDELKRLGAETVTPVVLLVKRTKQEDHFRIHLDVSEQKIMIMDDSMPAERQRQGYVGFPVDPGFVVGYGMDFEGFFRDLSYLGTVKSASDRSSVPATEG